MNFLILGLFGIVHRAWIIDDEHILLTFVIHVEHLLIRYIHIYAIVFPSTIKWEIVGFFHSKLVLRIFLLHSCRGHFYDKDRNSRIGPKHPVGSFEVTIC